MKKFLFVINPVSGNKSWNKYKELFHSAISDHNFIDFIMTEKPGHATHIAKNNKCLYDVIVAVGGDGTVNEVINGLEDTYPSIFGVLPIGSGNDFARTAGMTSDFSENMDLILRTNNVKYFNTGKISFSSSNSPVLNNSSYFINALGIGFDAFVAHLSHETKYLTGFIRYFWAVLKGLLKYKALEVEGLFDGHRKISGSKILVDIGNGKTSGGGFYLNPAAKPDDDLFDVCTAEDFSLLKILRILPLAIKGLHINKPGIESFTFKEANINLSIGNYVHADGEVIGKDVKRIHIKLCDNRIPVITGNNIH